MYACEQAERLGLTGWVRNRPDGTVEIVAEGEGTALTEFVKWCRVGPSHARVAEVLESYSEPTSEFDRFEITF